MHCTPIGREDPEYPAGLERCFMQNPPNPLWIAGNPGLLAHRTVALFCSSRSAGQILSRTYDLAQKLRKDGQTVISGFHAPMEKECLNILLRSPHAVIVCPARGLERMRLPSEWRRAFDEERLLVLSCFEPGVSRATAAYAKDRNRLAAAVANNVVIAHAAPGSRLAGLAREVLAWGKTLHTLDDPANAALLALGAQPLEL